MTDHCSRDSSSLELVLSVDLAVRWCFLNHESLFYMLFGGVAPINVCHLHSVLVVVWWCLFIECEYRAESLLLFLRALACSEPLV